MSAHTPVSPSSGVTYAGLDGTENTKENANANSGRGSPVVNCDVGIDLVEKSIVVDTNNNVAVIDTNIVTDINTNIDSNNVTSQKNDEVNSILSISRPQSKQKITTPSSSSRPTSKQIKFENDEKPKTPKSPDGIHIIENENKIISHSGSKDKNDNKNDVNNSDNDKNNDKNYDKNNVKNKENNDKNNDENNEDNDENKELNLSKEISFLGPLIAGNKRTVSPFIFNDEDSITRSGNLNIFIELIIFSFFYLSLIIFSIFFFPYYDI